MTRPPSPPPLLADAMLGRLATWLRLLGVDVAWDPDADDEAIVARLAREPDRLLLTRDVALAGRRALRDRARLVAATSWRAQLLEVVRALGIDPHAARFTRCLRCNVPTAPLAADAAAAGRVPPHVRENALRVTRCPRCDRVYWEGSHPERAAAVLADLFGDERFRDEPGADERAGTERIEDDGAGPTTV